MGKLSKKNVEALKKKAKELYAESVEKAKAEVAAHKERNENRVVLSVPLMGDTKLMSKLIQALMAESPQLSVMAVSLGPDGTSVRCTAASDMDDVEVNKWVQASMGTVGGKGGGRKNTANGTGKVTSTDELDKLISFAKTWS